MPVKVILGSTGGGSARYIPRYVFFFLILALLTIATLSRFFLLNEPAKTAHGVAAPSYALTRSTQILDGPVKRFRNTLTLDVMTDPVNCPTG